LQDKKLDGIQKLKKLAALITIGKASNGSSFSTDQGNFIADCDFTPLLQPAQVAGALCGRTGIVEHGLFFGLAHDVIVAGINGIQHLTGKT
jgi:ribose 5-phosphate isomerase A